MKSNKNDAADAEAICQAVAQPNMRFVPIKNIEQPSVPALHRVRDDDVDRTWPWWPATGPASAGVPLPAAAG